MTAFAQAPSALDELLLSTMADVERFLTELRQISDDDRSWRDRMQARCQALGESLQRAQEQLADRREEAREALASLREALALPFGEADVERDTEPSDATTGLAGFRRAMGQRYDELCEALEAQRIIEPEWVTETAHRRPQLLRALFHIIMGVSCAALYQWVVNRTQALWLLAGFVTFFGSVEIIRRFSTRVNDFWVDRVFGKVVRPQERYRTNSATWYMLGMAVITLLTPREVVIPALLVLAFGDPIASAVGHRWGIVRFANGKSLGGVLAFLAAAGLPVGLYLGLLSGLPATTGLALGAAMVAAGATVELLVERLDDNITIPVAAAGVGTLVLYLAG